MRIGIDLQASQTEGSRNRGIGRYSCDLAKAILRNKRNHEIFLNLNTLYKNTLSDLEKEFQEFSGEFTFTYNDLIDPTIATNTAERQRTFQVNSFLLKRQYNMQRFGLLHVSSIFEGLGGKAVVAENMHTLAGPVKSATLYDLIPLIYREEYLNRLNATNWYFRKLNVLHQMDLILAISESTRRDAINLLGLPAERIVNISGAVGQDFRKMESFNPDEKKRILGRYAIRQKFIMYTGGIDFRKNMERAIEGFSKIAPRLMGEYQFVLVCAISPDEKRQLRTVAAGYGVKEDKIVFTGYIPDNDLVSLYNLCDLFIFPSLYEGFGLPVLEAMTCGAAVIGSNVSSIPEIIGREDCLFDPRDAFEIARAINDILLHQTFRNEVKAFLWERSKLFSWDKCGVHALTAFEDVYKEAIVEKKTLITSVSLRKRIAYFSPLPDIQSGIADYSADLLPFLSHYFDIDLYVDKYHVSSDLLRHNYRIYDDTQFDSTKYDFTVYNFGNSQYHAHMYDILAKHPGIVVLHDFFLSGLICYISNIKGNLDFFFESVRHAHGVIGEEYISKYQSNSMNLEEIIRSLPANRQVVENALGVVVHSDFALELARTFSLPERKFFKVNQPLKIRSELSSEERKRARRRLNIDVETIAICAFGHIGPSKQYDLIIEALSSPEFQNRKFRVFFVGELSNPEYKSKIMSMIDRSLLKNSFEITGYVDNEMYETFLMAADIGINLRVFSNGETSRALLMNMAFGLPTIVNDFASFSEFPDDSVVKVKTNSLEDFRMKTKDLFENEALRREISRNARSYVNKNHSLIKCAQDYAITFLKILNSACDMNIDQIVKNISGFYGSCPADENDLKKMSEIIEKIIT